MKSINEFLNNTGLDNILLEVLSNTRKYTANEISDSLDILFESENLNFKPEDEQQLDELITINDGDYKKIDVFKDNYKEWIKKHNISTDDVDYLCFVDVFSEINGCIVIHIHENYFKQCKIEKDIADKLCVTSRGGNLRLDIYNYKKNFVIEKTLRSIKYDFSVSFFENFSKLVYNLDENKINKNTEENTKNNLQEDNKEVKTTIEDKKQVLVPLAKLSNVTGDQLNNVFNKIRKSIKMTTDTELGLAIMICGALLTVRNGGKNDKKAVGFLCEQLLKICKNPKSGLRNILK